jgi:8-oxo-dGTP pyrophosphatase MutT (NUDIX family)
MVSARVRCNRTGREEEFYRLVFPDWVNIVALTPERRLVLIQQLRFGNEKMEIEIPGGAIEKDESPVVAGCRELLEETGYAGKNARLIGTVSPNPAIQNNRCYTVLIEDVEQIQAQEMDDMEDIEVMLVAPAEVENWIAQGRISHGLVLNALMFYEKSGLPR